jgi:hypothetical protein
MVVSTQVTAHIESCRSRSGKPFPRPVKVYGWLKEACTGRNCSADPDRCAAPRVAGAQRWQRARRMMRRFSAR